MKETNKNAIQQLRRKAEALLKEKVSEQSPILSESQALKLIHELEVHQIELEIQNDELELAKLQAAKVADEKYAELYDFAPSGYFSLSKDGLILMVNLAGAKMLGKERLFLLNSYFEVFISPETKSNFRVFLENIFAGFSQESCQVKFLIIGKLPMTVQLNGIVSEHEKQCLVTAVDITALKQAEQTLKTSELYLKYTQKIARLGTFIIDFSTEKWTSSEVFDSLIGIEPDFDKSNNGWMSIVHPEWLEIMRNYFYEEVVAGKKEFDKEYKIIRKNDHSERWVHVLGRLEFDENDKPRFFVGALRDITNRKNAEEVLTESEHRLKSLVSILQFNTDMIYELLDFTLEEAIKLTNSKLGYIYFYEEQKKEFTLHSWSREVMEECTILEKKTVYKLEETGLWGEAVRQRKPIMVNDFESNHPLKKGYPEGHAHLFKFLTIPVIINENIVAVIGVANKETDYKETDILHLTLLMDNTWKTLQKKRIEELVTRQNSELLKLNEDKDRFIAILAHDLKNPFNSMLGFLDLLESNLHKYNFDKIEKLITIINQSAQRVYNLLEDITTWAISQSGKLTFEPQHLKFSEVCADVIADVKLLADNKSIKINQKYDKGITVFADLTMLKIIIRNLVSNAAKFTSFGGRIDIRAENDSEKSTIVISDNGIGIGPDDITKLFDISQKYSTKGTMGESGTGLGLLLCKEFVEKHQGKIWVESEPGKGSDFKFTLPEFIELQEKKTVIKPEF